MRRNYGVDIFGTIAEKLSSLSGFPAMANELVQNADDEESEYIEFDFRDDGLSVTNASVFDDDDFKRICNIASRGKATEPDKTGAFGIGFISVYQVTDHPEVQSAGEKYIFLPEQKVVESLDSKINDHTEFFLPWAFDPKSIVRTELKREAIDKNDIPRFAQELLSSSPDILLFLRNLRKIRVLRNGLLDTEFIRDDAAPPLRIIAQMKEGKPTIVRKWFAYEELFVAPEAAQLNKEPKIGIAFPILPNNIQNDGILYDFLPTGLYTGYKFHINGDFFPTPDRKNIITEGDKPKVDWNSKVINATGKFIIKCIIDLKQRVTVEELYKFFPAHDFSNKNLPILEAIKRIFYASAKEQEIVPDGLNEWHKPDGIYLLSLKDANVRRALEDIRIPIVNSKLRSSWPILQAGLGTKNLDIGTLTRFIQEMRIKAGTFQINAPKPFNTIKGLSNLLLFVQDRMNTPGEEKLLNSFSQLAICPDRKGRLDQFEKLKLMTPTIERVLLKPDGIPFVNASLQAQCKEILLHLTSEYVWQDVIDFFSTKTSQEITQMDKANVIDLMVLYDYLADHEQPILKDYHYCEKLKNSCIFMTNKQFKPLSGLCLSGNYKDPMGLDIIIADSILTDKAKGFLKKLGVKSLDFPTYVTKYAPLYFQSEPLWRTEDKRLELTEEIRRNFSLISDNKDARNLLKTLEMIPCNDNQFHAPEKIYLRSELLDIVLAKNYLYPDEQRIGKNSAEWNEWLKLLDVSDSPKPEDVIRRIRELAAKWSPENVQAIEQLFYYLCDIFNQDSFSDEKAYEQLKYLEWLPAEGDEDNYHLPAEVFLPFSKHLFYSQGKFVPFSQRARMRGRFLDYIGIGNYPSFTQIVKYLQWLAGQNIAPHFDIYRVLNDGYDKIPEETLALLRESSCIFIDGKGYCDAGDCFWGNHPFGVYRQKASDRLRNYYNILKRIGVKEEPQLEDYLKVLVDISNKFANGNHPLDEDAKKVANTIYSFTSQHMSEISEDQFNDLSKKKVVLDRLGFLRIPNHMFFEDKGIMVDIFRERLKNELIDKESDTWQLLERLGVHHLSKAIHPVDFRPSNDRCSSDADMEVIKSRKLAIMTIVETQRKDFTDGWDLVSLDSLEVYEAAALSVKYEIKMDGRSIYSDDRSELSFYDRDVNRLYVSRSCTGQERTYEIARNLAAILNPQIDPCHILPVLVEVLNPSQESSTIDRYLQHMGYDIVTEPPVRTPSDTEREEPFETSETENRPGADDEEAIGDQRPESEMPPFDRPGEGTTKPEHKEAKKKRGMPGLSGESADEIDKKRKAWLQERLEQERTEHPSHDSDYASVDRDMTPEEKENHKRFALIFYNRQIQELMSRVNELKTGEGPAQYSIYGPEWEEVSKLVRQRDGNKCRRCGLSEEDGVTLAVHHICPRKAGGSNWHSNLITLCRTCHAEVEDRPWLL